jgi:ubiquinone biosynthesis protein Coq4
MDAIFTNTKSSIAPHQQGLVEAFLDAASGIDGGDVVFNIYKQLDLLAKTPEDGPRIMQALHQVPAIHQAIVEGYLAPKYEVADLAHYKPGSLGYAYYRHLHDNGFTPDFFPAIEVKDDWDYFQLRRLQTHDIWHTLTGHNASPSDEVRLQAFYVAQLPTATLSSVVLIAAGLMRGVLNNTNLINIAFDVISQGWQQGLAAKPIYAVKWEEMWERSLAELRQEYNIVPYRTIYDF